MAVSTTDFIASLVITNYCLKYLQLLTTSLQAEAKDIVGATSEISSVKEALQDARRHIDEHHSRWFCTVEVLCSDIGVEPSLPHCCSWQTHCLNVPSDTPSVYYC